MVRSIEELIESREKTFVTIQRLFVDLEYRRKLIERDFGLTEEEREQGITKVNATYSNRIYKYYRFHKFLDDTIAKIEYVEWNESIQNEINQLVNNNI